MTLIKFLNNMKIYGYTTHYHINETGINAYEFGILPSMCLVNNHYGNKQLFLHWLIFGLEINF